MFALKSLWLLTLPGVTAQSSTLPASALPDSFGRLSQLRLCEFPKNRLRSLCESFGQLESLTLLDLSSPCALGWALRSWVESLDRVQSLGFLILV